MGYFVALNYPDGRPCVVKKYSAGGILQLDPETGEFGQTTTDISITYNYSADLNNSFNFCFQDLNGKTGKETVEKLAEIVESFGTAVNPDYWLSTPGNIGHICDILKGWAVKHPDAIWAVS